MEAFSQTSLPDFQITQSICENLLKSNAKGVHVHTHTQTSTSKSTSTFFPEENSELFPYQFSKGSESPKSRLESGPRVCDGE